MLERLGTNISMKDDGQRKILFRTKKVKILLEPNPAIHEERWQTQILYASSVIFRVKNTTVWAPATNFSSWFLSKRTRYKVLDWTNSSPCTYREEDKRRVATYTRHDPYISVLDHMPNNSTFYESYQRLKGPKCPVKNLLFRGPFKRVLRPEPYVTDSANFYTALGEIPLSCP